MLRCHKMQLWHSGMLLILFVQLLLLFTPAYSEVSSEVLLADVGTLECSCEEKGCSEQWRFNGEDIGNISEVLVAGTLECVGGATVQIILPEPVEPPTVSLELSMTSETPSVQGGSLVLLCKASVTNSNLAPKFIWTKGGNELLIEHASIEAVSATESRLSISPLAKEDAGNYVCKADLAGVTALSEDTVVSVSFGPQFSETPSDKEVQFGEGFTLRCAVNAAPEATISWTLNGQAVLEIPEELISVEENGGLLIVAKADLASTGEFSCTAKNEIEEKSEKAKVELIYEEPSVQISPSDSNIFLLEGSPLKIECSATGIPQPEILWLRNEDNSTNLANSLGALDLTSVTQQENDSTFTCIAKNHFGRAESSPVKVGVARSTQILSLNENLLGHLGDGLTLDCSFDKDERLEEAKVGWTKNGGKIENEEKEIYSIETVDLSSAGEYSCQVTTALDSASKTFTVSLAQKPIIDKSFETSMFVIRGSKVSIPCTASGIPEPVIRWQGRDNSILNLDNIQEEGNFVCKAENKHGDSDRRLQIVPVKATKLSQENRTVVSRHAGNSLLLNCSMEIDPLLTANARRVWIKDGVLLQEALDKNVLELSYLREDSAGTYTCKVTTDVDDVLLAQTVSVVSAKPKIMKEHSEAKVLSGENATLNCEVEGIPMPQISWKYKSEIVPGAHEQALELTKVSLGESEGVYTCLAVNEYGSDQMEFRLDVYKKISFKRGPKNILVKSLERSVFRCEVEVDSRLKQNLTLQWFKNGTEAVDENLILADNSLVIKKTLKTDEGTYTCVASTPYETLNQTARLTALGEPPSFIATEKDARALEGAKVTISCQANGLPMPNISWQRNNTNNNTLEDVIIGERIKQLYLGDLEISSLDLKDQGEYICSAVNVYGRVETKSTLQVIRRAAPSTGQYVREITRSMRGNATLDCDVSYDERLTAETKVVWSKDGIDIQFEEHETKYMLINSGHSLFVDDLSVLDKGVYECSVKTPFETIGSKMTLGVSGEAPKILSKLKKVTLYEGEDLNLKCLVRGTPTPTLKWLFNDKPVSETVIVKVPTASNEFVESHVSIPAASKADEGVYQCETSNKYGSGVAKFAKVAVVRRTRVQISSDDEKSFSVRAGERLLMPCKVENDLLNRITNIQWTKDGDPINIGPKDRIDFGMDGSLTVTDIQRRHEGEYRCTASTMLDNATDTANVRVIVNAPVITTHSEDQVLFSGDTVDISCTANGIPPPSIRWTFNKTRTGVRAPRLQITNAITSDAGHYVCTAKNDYGETRQMINVVVVPLPALQPEYQLKEGGRFQLPCVPKGKNVGATWMKNGDQLSDDNDNFEVQKEKGFLVFRNITSETPGVYSCIIISSSGRRKTLQTVVKLKPNLITAESSGVVVRAGDRLELSCAVLPGIDTKRLWKHRDQFFIEGGSRDINDHGGVLIIDPVEKSDSGVFSCVAIASFGQDVVEHAVRVLPALPGIGLPESAGKGCGQLSTTALSEIAPVVIAVRPQLESRSAAVQWVLPAGLNRSCFEAISVSWWNNASESAFTEKRIDLSDESAVIDNLSPKLGYYLQVNLVAPLNVFHYGETRAFNLHEEFLDFSLTSDQGLTEEASSDMEGLYLPLAIGIGCLLVLFVLLVVVIALFIKRRWLSSKLKGGHHQLSQEEASLRRKRHLNGAAISMYDGRIHISQPYAVNTAACSGSAGGDDDFMESLMPQWPEPEPEPSINTETEAFLPDTERNSTAGTSCSSTSNHALPLQPLGASACMNTSGISSNPGHLKAGGGRRGSKASIGSSWSSLFNQLNPDSSGSVRSSTVSSSGGNGGGNSNRVSFAGIGSGRSYRTRAPTGNSGGQVEIV